MMALINPQSNRCVPPNIFMYIDKDSKLTCDTIGSLGIFLSAYIYAQEADINIKNKGRPNTNYNYNNYGTQSKDVAIVGACVFDDITCNGESTIVFVPSKSPPRLPQSTWKYNAPHGFQVTIQIIQTIGILIERVKINEIKRKEKALPLIECIIGTCQSWYWRPW
jgi:hypothetical protein